MQNFNLVVSTARDFEIQAITELWFNLIALGDNSPIIYPSSYQGLILAQTSLPPRKIVYYLREIITSKDPEYIQFIQKIYPVDCIVPTEIPQIEAAIPELMKKSPLCESSDSKFRITIRKRNSPLQTDTIVNAIGSLVHHPVDLKHFDWNIQLEIFGNTTGIAIITEDDIFKPLSKQNEYLYTKEELLTD